MSLLASCLVVRKSRKNQVPFFCLTCVRLSFILGKITVEKSHSLHTSCYNREWGVLIIPVLLVTILILMLLILLTKKNAIKSLLNTIEHYETIATYYRDTINKRLESYYTDYQTYDQTYY